MVGGEYTQRRNAERPLKLPLNALALLTLTQSVWHRCFYLHPFAIPLSSLRLSLVSIWVETEWRKGRRAHSHHRRKGPFTKDVLTIRGRG